MFEKMEFYFLDVSLKKLENFGWRFGKLSTLYLSAFFAFYFKSYVLEALEILRVFHPDLVT